MSLRSISLRDFVIVKELDLDLTDGFTVLTGETGAGKSILIDALQLALGARADAGVVREGALRCEISAEFDSPASLLDWFEEAGFTAGDTLLLRRTIDAQGKSRAWINGSAATATQLKDIADKLVDIHGQHAWQSLTRPDAVRGLLDSYGAVPTQLLAQQWQQWRGAQKTLLDARNAQDNLQRERERLAWQIGEVDKLAPATDEWVELNAQHSRLSNAQALRDAVQSALDALQESEQNATRALGQALRRTTPILTKPKRFQNCAPRLHPLWPRPSRKRCKGWVCKAASLRSHLAHSSNRLNMGWSRLSFWLPGTVVARRARLAKSHRVASCRVLRWRLP